MRCIDRVILDEIQAYALDIDWNKAFEGKAYGNRHLFRVVTIATFLAEKEGARQDICEAGAWLHDVGLIVGNDDNPTTIRRIAEAYLRNLDLDTGQVRSIAGCAETHEGCRSANSLEARIVHDADVLDKMGLLGVIRHTWKIVNLIAPQANAQEVCNLVQTHLHARQERLYTTTARKIVVHLNAAQQQFFMSSKQASEQIALIMQSVRQGAISDQIAATLLLKTDNRSLLHQLSISHEILQWWCEQENQEA